MTEKEKFDTMYDEYDDLRENIENIGYDIRKCRKIDTRTGKDVSNLLKTLYSASEILDKMINLIES